MRELGQKLQFHTAGDTPQDQIDVALLSGEIDTLYLEWGLLEVTELEIDGAVATPGILMASGPEDLTKEIVAAIKEECGLTATEAKN